MSDWYDCGDPAELEAGLAEAASALLDGKLVVFPTDTVYGFGADAFTPAAVSSLLATRGGSRSAPPSVLVGTVRAAAALMESLGPYGTDLIDEFWPGPLTLVFKASSTLAWDLGDTLGTVAVRMPLHAIALDLLQRTGPLAVSSASKRGEPSATTAVAAREQLGEAVAVYLDGGACADITPSTILDLTGTVPRLLRAGAISIDDLRKVVPVIDLPDPALPAQAPSPADQRAQALIKGMKAADAGRLSPDLDRPEVPDAPEALYAPEIPEAPAEPAPAQADQAADD